MSSDSARGVCVQRSAAQRACLPRSAARRVGPPAARAAFLRLPAARRPTGVAGVWPLVQHSREESAAATAALRASTT